MAAASWQAWEVHRVAWQQLDREQRRAWIRWECDGQAVLRAAGLPTRVATALAREWPAPGWPPPPPLTMADVAARTDAALLARPQIGPLALRAIRAVAPFALPGDWLPAWVAEE